MATDEKQELFKKAKEKKDIEDFTVSFMISCCVLGGCGLSFGILGFLIRITAGADDTDCTTGINLLLIGIAFCCTAPSFAYSLHKYGKGNLSGQEAVCVAVVTLLVIAGVLGVGNSTLTCSSDDDDETSATNKLQPGFLSIAIPILWTIAQLVAASKEDSQSIMGSISAARKIGKWAVSEVSENFSENTSNTEEVKRL